MSSYVPKHSSFIAHLAVILATVNLVGASALGSNLDTIGATVLSATTTNLNGAGVRVAQPEADAPAWEVNPAAVGQPANLFTYYSASGTTNSFPNDLGVESGHAAVVGNLCYGIVGGVVTNLAHVDNYDADYFASTIVPTLNPIAARIVNQSFVFPSTNITEQQNINTTYDSYVVQYNTLFVSGVDNGGPVKSPAACYNGIGVGAYGGASSVGPTLDNGRAKPDLTAPAGATSYSTPQVAGAAALLLQAGTRGDGGSDTNSAVDVRTLKALLLNGAVKPADWTRTNASPLDARYGAGVLNVFNSYRQLAGGKHVYIVFSSVASGNPHPPTGAPGTVSGLSGWDFNSVASGPATDGVNHYYFNVTNGVSNAAFTATATLVWNRQPPQNADSLDLFLYDANSGSLITASTSLVDNVEHVYVPQLPAGRYDLQVFRKGAGIGASRTYALAFEFFSESLNLAVADGNAVLTWPVYPDGFVLESTPNLAPPITWSAVNPLPTVTNNQNRVIVSATVSNQFFRLKRP